MSRVKHRPLKEVAKEILKKYKEHEELMIRLLSKNEYLRQRDLKVLEIEIGMYENEIERASAESVSHGKWIVAPFTFLFKDVYSDTQIVCNCCKCVFDTLDNDTDRFKYYPNCGARMDEE